MDRTELCFLSAAELGRLFRRKAVSPVEVVESLLERIEASNHNLVAYLFFDPERALVEAKRAEAEIVAGGYRGPLHGIPVAYKDIYNVAGLPTTAASRVMQGYVATEDSFVAGRLRLAGPICMGKLDTFEFASGSMEVFGPPRTHGTSRRALVAPARVRRWRLQLGR